MANELIKSNIKEKEYTTIIKDIEKVETSNMYINEKKYYLKLIELLQKIGYYKEGRSLKEIGKWWIIQC